MKTLIRNLESGTVHKRYKNRLKELKENREALHLSAGDEDDNVDDKI